MKPKIVEVAGAKYIAATDDGKPIFITDDGKETSFDAPATLTRIAGLNKEAQTWREAKEAAEAKLKAFEGIEDADAARAAMATVSNLKAGDLKTAEQVNEIKEAARRAAEQQVQETARQSAAKLAELGKERDELFGQLVKEKVGGSFSRSKFINEKTILPGEAAQNIFGNNFKVENGNIIPYGVDGNKIYSRRPEKAGEVADFEEGIEILFESYPHKNSFLKGTNHSGGGAREGNGRAVGANGKPQMSRSQFESLAPMAKGEAVRTHQIID